ncbi:hypothetical protein A2899_03620 [Candidatus Amesbacteria bacterium RIFCSPLOWO2_01_FULL_49_25]|nr:MAG: hypothetical protein A2899_03620 [Candidatus Amesbacteria bacterium RIFCSPLOWO2_01_FULL_49_25]
MPDNLASLLEFLKIPSISTLPEHEPDMRQARDYLIRLFKSLGFTTQILPAQKHPAVFAQKLNSRKNPTVLIYGHYDVQPPDPLDQWQSSPFKPLIKNGKVYSRGATDNKGQLMVHISAIQKLIAKYGKNLPLNFKFLIEGEEEIGSPSISNIAKKYNRLLKSDYLVVSDTEMPTFGQPAIHTRLRGLTYTEIRLQTAAHDAHSGQFGGVIPNPGLTLSHIISRLKNDKNHVLIPGFYDDVLVPSPQELADFAATEPKQTDVLHESSAFSIGGGESSYSLNQRRWTQPTLDVNGMLCGFTGSGSKTIIPSTAMAKLSMRLVPNQNPDKIFKLFSRYIRSLTPKGTHIEIINHASALPYVAPTSHPIFALAKSCLQKAFGQSPIFYATGGSIGAIPLLTQSLGGVPCLMIAMGNSDDNLHAPNEHFSLSNYTKGISAMTDFYFRLSSKLDNTGQSK